MAKKQKLIGIDMGSSEIRCVEVIGSEDDFVITGFGYAPVEDPENKESSL